MERRYTSRPARIESRSDGKAKIKGYASVFYREGDEGTQYTLWDNEYGRAVERILPGAFDRALREKQDAAALFNHDPNFLLGRVSAGTLSLRVDETGLAYDIDPADTQASRDVQEHIRRGDVSGSSFSFTIPAQGDRWTRTTDSTGKVQEVREVLDVDLFDVSPVVYPAYQSTSVDMRSCRDISDLKAQREAAALAERLRQAELIELEAMLAENTIEVA